MEADYASPHVNPAPYPVTDDEGYYMAYKDGDAWVNWWAKSKWGVLGLLAQFLFTKVSIRFTYVQKNVLAIECIILSSNFANSGLDR